MGTRCNDVKRAACDECDESNECNECSECSACSACSERDGAHLQREEVVDGANVIFRALDHRVGEGGANAMELVQVEGDDGGGSAADDPDRLELDVAHVQDAWVHHHLDPRPWR